MINKLVTRLAAVAVISVFSMGSQAASVTSVFSVTGADMTSLLSGSLDAPCLQGGGQFFVCTDMGDILSKSALVTITNTNTNGGGSLVLQYDDITGAIESVKSFDVQLGDMQLDLTHIALGDAVVQVISGNSFPGASDYPTMLAGYAGSNGSADADQNGGSASVFQHDAPAAEFDAPGFSSFPDIVDSCTPVGTATICALIPALAIDGVRYELTGLINAGGASSLSFRVETANNSNYFGDLTLGAATPVPVPAAVWLFGSALGLLGWMRRRVS